MTGILNALIAGVSGAVKDAYFNLVSLLLPGNGTNGAQNNTFLDSSTNNFTITRNGNTTQGTFSPFSQTGWGNYFDGTRDYLTLPSTSNLAFGTGDFSIEAWVYPTSVAEESIISNATTSGAGDTQLTFYISNSVQLSGWFTIFLTGSTNISLNAWSHVVVCRTGTTMSIFLNGIRDATGTVSNNFSSTNAFWVGAYPSATAGDFNGYITNLRVLKGSSAYDPTQTTITVPTAPLTAITNTQLLTCQSNRFIDNSTNNFTITPNGNTSVVAFSPFAPTAAYTTAAVGGSGYFDGTGDYLSVADNANLRFGTSAFTIQAWVYRNASGVAHSIIAKGSASTGYVLQVTSTNVLRFTHGTTNVDTTTTIPVSAWTHVAAVRTNTSTNGFQLYINGVSSATATVSTDFNQTDSLYIGGDRSAANVMNGYISGLKYTNGTAESISVPTEPPTATTNVALLTNYTNAGITDATAKNDLETVGNAQISTSVSKFGGGSIYLDGTGDYLVPSSASSNILLGFGTGDFTIEFWVYFAGGLGSDILLYDGRPLSTNGAYPTIYVNSSSQLSYVVSSADRITSSSAFSTSIWYHIAVSRSGTSTKMFVNGTQVGSTYTDSTNYLSAARRPTIGINGFNESAGGLNGYIDDLRVSRVARYTSNFTAPTAPFPVQ